MIGDLTKAEAYGARALTYRFLAGLYLEEPKAAWLAGLAAEGLLDEFPVAPGNREMEQGLSLLKAACLRLGQDDSGSEAKAVLLDYTRLFIGADRLPAPPWESVYRSDERVLFDWPTREVRSEYLRTGLALRAVGDPDDHVGLELLFLAILCERAAAGDSEAESARRSFLQNHLLQWAPAFAADLAAGATTDLYRGLAALTAGFLSMERHAMGV